MKTLFEKWWNKNTKCINLISYKDAWDKPHFLIHNNGAKRKNGDTCFDFNVDLGYLHFSYTNWDLQGHMKKKSENFLKHELTKKIDVSNWTMEKPTDVNYCELLNNFDLKRCKHKV